MSIFKTLIRQLASNGFRLGIVLLAIISALLAAFGSPQVVKHALDNSGIYNDLSSAIVKQATTADTANQSDTTIAAEQSTLQQPEVQAAAKAAFNAPFLQSSSDQIVDGTYHWLTGKTASPDFTVDLTPAIKVFEDKAATAGSERLKKLPACTLQQLREINPSSIDPFQLSCLPSGFNVDSQRQAFIDSLAGKNEFIRDPILTADRLPKDSNGKTVFEKASIAPKVFHWITVGPWVFGALSVVLALAVILLSTPRRKGLSSLAMSLVVNGLLLVALGLIAGYLFSRYFMSASSPLHLSSDTIQQSVVNIVGTFNRLIVRTMIIFGAAYTVIGAIIMIVLRLTRRARTSQADPLADRRTAERSTNI